MIRNIVVYSCLALSMLTALADKTYPMLEFIKNGEVIETRQMTESEYETYMNLKSLELELSRLDGPLAEFEEVLDVETELRQRQALLLVEERLISDNEHNPVDGIEMAQANINALTHMMDKMQPMITELATVSADLTTHVTSLTTSLMKDYDRADIDRADK